MKRFRVILILVLISICAFSLMPQVYAMMDVSFPEITGRVIDDANLLSDSEEATLKNTVDSISAQYQCDVVVSTVTTFGDSGLDVRVYAADLFEHGDFGVGDGKDGILFMVSPAERDWAMIMHGFGSVAVDDWGYDYITSAVLKPMGEDDYYGAFTTFAKLSGDFLAQARTGKPYSQRNKIKAPKNYLVIALVSAAVGLLAAFITTSGMKSKLKGIRKQTMAHNYVRDGSFKLVTSSDRFLYSKVDKVKKESSSSGGTNSGSGTVKSSSGGSYTGGGGKY